MVDIAQEHAMPHATTESQEIADKANEFCQAWPTLALDPTDFIGFLQAKYQSVDDALSLSDLHCDLALVYACLQGDNAAIAACDDLLENAAGIAFRRITHEAREELVQDTRARLYTGAGKQEALLLSYQGRSSLIGWLRAILVHAGIKAKKLERRHVALEDEHLDQVIDPLLPNRRQAYIAAFRTALRASLMELEPSQRTLLRQHYFDGLSTRALGKLQGVDSTTVSRRIVKTRDALGQATRLRMAQALELDSVGSVLDWLNSQLDASLSSLFVDDCGE